MEKNQVITKWRDYEIEWVSCLPGQRQDGLDIYIGLLLRGYIFWDVEEGRIEGKGSSPISTHLLSYFRVNFQKTNLISPPLLKTFKTPLDFWISIMWPQSTTLVGPFLQFCTSQLCQNSPCSLTSLSWHKESFCLGLPWLLSFVWLTPPHPSCLTSSIASPGLSPQIPSPPLYLERYCSLYQGLESFL